MKNIDELISKKNGEISVDGVAISSEILKRLSDEGYAHIEADKDKRTVLVWSTDRAANFTENQLSEQYGPDSKR